MGCVEEQFKILLLIEGKWLLAMTRQLYGNWCCFGFGLVGAFCMLCWGRGSMGMQREAGIVEWGAEPMEQTQQKLENQLQILAFYFILSLLLDSSCNYISFNKHKCWFSLLAALLAKF